MVASHEQDSAEPPPAELPLAEPPLAEPPIAGDEVATLLGCLERQRATFAWKTGGLDHAGLTARTAASTMTLGGLVKHLAGVEEHKLSVMLLGTPMGPPWDAVDWAADEDWDWNSAAQNTPEQLYGLWRDAVARSRSNVDAALVREGLDTKAAYTTPTGESPGLRRLLFDLLEEYARHVGHADVLREAVDGLVGADPPS